MPAAFRHDKIGIATNSRLGLAFMVSISNAPAVGACLQATMSVAVACRQAPTGGMWVGFL